MEDGLTEYRACAARVAEGERASARCDALTNQIDAEAGKLAELGRQVDRSEHRVAGLEGHSLAHVVAALRRRSDQELGDAQAEVRATQMEIATRQNALRQLRAERDRVQTRAASLEADRRALDQARQLREEWITQSGGEHAERLQALTARHNQLAHTLSECEEVTATAHQAQTALDDCLQQLSSAGSWATYDTFFNGGILAASMEHRRVDEAAQTISAAQAVLQKLGAEIQALQDPHALLPEISPGLKVANIWFDNIFSDWMVRSRINASQDAIRATSEKVGQLIEALGKRHAAMTAELQRSDDEYATLLGSARTG